MVSGKINVEKAREIVNVLPQKNCGKCGFENCGKFALAVLDGKASPFGCHQDFSTGYTISKILGIEIPEVIQSQPGPQDRIRHGHGREGHHGSHHCFGHHGHRK